MVSAHGTVDRNIRDLALNLMVGIFAGMGAYLTCRLAPYIPLLAYMLVFVGIFLVASAISNFPREVGPGPQISVARSAIKKVADDIIPVGIGLMLGFLGLYQLRI